MPSFPRFPLLILTAALSFPGAAKAQVIPIGQVQGAVLDSERGTAHKSPFAAKGQTPGPVTVRGVVTGRTLALDKEGPLHGFFVQNTKATADRDERTSDGIWVFLGKVALLRNQDPAEKGHAPQVGDELEISARVTEYFGQTQLTSARLLNVLRRNVDLAREVPAFLASPPDDREAANRYWERREGMVGRVEAGSMVVAGRHNMGVSDSELYLISPNHPVARRPEVYARRVFRDFHPLDNRPETPVDDGNGFRIAVGSQGLKGAAGQAEATLPAVATFASLAEDLTGPVLYSFGKYLVQPSVEPRFTAGADPSQNAAPRAPRATQEYSIATFNLENLYDFRDDPNDGCDFEGNTGCTGITPPYDYVPKSGEHYQTRLRYLARQIIQDLHNPTVLLLQEAEDQDICSVVDGGMSCGTADNADGKPDTVQELALEIARQGGAPYEAAYDRDGADTRGIASAFLLRTGRASLVPVAQAGPLFETSPALTGFGSSALYNGDRSNPKSLNALLEKREGDTDGNLIYSRPPLCAAIDVRHPDGSRTRLFAIANHYSSGPTARVEQRRQQAAFGAALTRYLAASDPGARVVLGGDLNVHPRPDDPFDPSERKSPSDQLAALYDSGLYNAFDVILKEVPAAAYSYVFGGQAQTLDHLFFSPALRGDLVEARYAHINADWPGEEAVEQGGKIRGASDHDPLLAIFTNLPAPAGGNWVNEKPGPIVWP